MNNKELQKLHNKILELVEYFDKFCQENGIVYYLMGGTALGAIRHHGFIPWDDDFDVFMDYNNYSKFLEVVEERLDLDKYYCQKENTKEWPLYFSKIRMNNTTFIEKDVKDRNMHHGIYIDIMCLNNAHSNKYIRYLQYISARILSSRALADKGYITHSLIKKYIIILSKITILKPIKRMLLNFVRSLNDQETELVGHFFGRAPFKKTSFYKSFLGKSRYVKFENLSLPVPSNVEGYLQVRYGGNYMQLPSEKEKMKYPSHAYIVDTTTSYKKYIK
jgi:lipopolysaccharide cholinephosphotransferase